MVYVFFMYVISDYIFVPNRKQAIHSKIPFIRVYFHVLPENLYMTIVKI